MKASLQCFSLFVSLSLLASCNIKGDKLFVDGEEKEDIPLAEVVVTEAEEFREDFDAGMSVEELLSARGVDRSTIRTVTDKSPSDQLLWAAEHGHSKVVSKLLKDRVIPNIQNSYGDTPLNLAAWKGQTATVRVLLNHQYIDPNLADNEGWTPLMYTARCSNHAALIARAILAHEDTNPNLQQNDKWTALMMAARHNNAATVKAIIEHRDTNPNLQQNDNWTALMLAACYNDAATVKAILAHPDTELDVQSSHDNGCWTALMLAAQEGKKEAVRALLKAGADKTLQNKWNSTARDIAQQNGHTAVMTLIDQY